MRFKCGGDVTGTGTPEAKCHPAPKYVLAIAEETCWGSELGESCTGKETWVAGTTCPGGYEKVTDFDQCKEAATAEHLGKAY